MLWNNKNITITGKSIYWKDWHAAGATFLMKIVNFEVMNKAAA